LQLPNGGCSVSLKVAVMLGVSQGRIRHLVRVGALPSVRLCGTGYHRFRREDVEALISGQAAP
jgi:excisionase family DNA binding protein